MESTTYYTQECVAVAYLPSETCRSWLIPSEGKQPQHFSVKAAAEGKDFLDVSAFILLNQYFFSTLRLSWF